MGFTDVQHKGCFSFWNQLHLSKGKRLNNSRFSDSLCYDDTNGNAYLNRESLIGWICSSAIKCSTNFMRLPLSLCSTSTSFSWIARTEHLSYFTIFFDISQCSHYWLSVQNSYTQAGKWSQTLTRFHQPSAQIFTAPFFFLQDKTFIEQAYKKKKKKPYGAGTLNFL